VVTTFIENFEARGAMLCFIYINNGSNMAIDFEVSYCQTVMSRSSLLKLPLIRGLYIVYAYDIESNMRLLDGTGYPASSKHYRVARNIEGN
jgi:hypothetical protein